MPTTTIEANQCSRCGYVWKSKIKLPLRCAKCRSPYWDRKKNMIGGAMQI